MPIDPTVDRILKSIEEDASRGSELDQIVAFGPAFYSTGDLLRLLGKWEATILHFRELHRALLWIGASSPAWIIISLLMFLFGLPRAGYFIIALFPLSFLVFVAGAFWLKKRFTSQGHLEHIGELIRQELKRRSK